MLCKMTDIWQNKMCVYPLGPIEPQHVVYCWKALSVNFATGCV